MFFHLLESIHPSEPDSPYPSEEKDNSILSFIQNSVCLSLTIINPMIIAPYRLVNKELVYIYYIIFYISLKVF